MQDCLWGICSRSSLHITYKRPVFVKNSYVLAGKWELGQFISDSSSGRIGLCIASMVARQLFPYITNCGFYTFLHQGSSGKLILIHTIGMILNALGEMILKISNGPGCLNFLLDKSCQPINVKNKTRGGEGVCVPELL